ncbi:hypothetical protein BGAL_0209g00130 [Botrytis galanthina]|uniref:Uncharacterized protein n=1 Tax=Botrytis galanthina TaxID=278940 RepID=A0A4S8R7C0_9HELO|nr:hypothetical protein BGAL_0209g00130 [Botrytis galanthina]
MFSSIVHLSYTFVVLTSIFTYVKADCASYGIDFQNGGNYFINSVDNSSFTAVTQFTGCSGEAEVILIAPNDDSWECSGIETQPDNTNMLSTCPISKNQMYSGTWTILILANNGAGDSFAAQRTFELTVGTQATVTYIPTVNITNVVTPSTTVPTTITDTDSTTLPAVTITAASATAKNTVTVTPKKVTTTKTTTSTRTITSRKYTFPIVTVTKTASCRLPTKPPMQDVYPNQHFLLLAQSVTSNSSVKRTAMPAPAAAVITPAPRANPESRDAIVDIANVLGRRAVGRVIAKKLKKRAPDVPTVTVTDTTTSDWITSTVTSTAATTTFFSTDHSTPAPVTIRSGITTATVTAPTPTTTKTTQTLTITTVTSTITYKYAITITKTTTPASVIATCTSKGGSIV